MGGALALLLSVGASINASEFNVHDYGAKGDARIVHDANMEGRNARLHRVSDRGRLLLADIDFSKASLVDPC